MKKWKALLYALICILSLAACGGKSQEMSAYEKDKLDFAGSDMTLYMIDLLNSFIDDDNYEYYSKFKGEELEYIMETTPDIQLLVDGYGLKSAMESFHLSGKTTGQILDVKNVEARIDGSQIVINADVICEKKNADVELILSNDLFMRLEGGALNPKAEFGELMEKAALNTLIGMGTVFAVLILISLIIALFVFVPALERALTKISNAIGAAFAGFFALFRKKKEEDSTAAGIDKAVAQIAQQEEESQTLEDDTELVAVIAAAIAAYEGSTNTEGFVVRSIRRR